MHKKPKDPEEAVEKDMLSEEVKQTSLQEVRVKLVLGFTYTNAKAKMKFYFHSFHPFSVIFTDSVSQLRSNLKAKSLSRSHSRFNVTSHVRLVARNVELNLPNVK